jgi:hypothetical protein
MEIETTYRITNITSTETLWNDGSERPQHSYSYKEAINEMS